jgi:hypothetical protein
MAAAGSRHRSVCVQHTPGIIQTTTQHKASRFKYFW